AIGSRVMRRCSPGVASASRLGRPSRARTFASRLTLPMQPAGTVRVERALALTGSATIGLLGSWKVAPRVSHAVDAWSSLRSMSGTMTSRTGVLLGQFAASLPALAMGVGAGVLWAFASRSLVRHRRAERIVGWIVPLLALALAVGISVAFG